MSYTPTIFIVDDDNTVQTSLKSMFQTAGYDVEAYTSCRGFTENFRDRERACLILDLNLQDMGAWQPTAFLKERGADIPVVLTTRPGDPTIQSQLSGCGTLALLEKPLDHGLMLKTINAILR